jgi:triacylglycerol lipase
VAGQRESREELIEIANGYFEAIGTHDRGAARVSADCTERAAGQPTSCLEGIDAVENQQVIERRFPLVIPELGIVVAYGFIMHHEQLPPRDELINVSLRIADGRIKAINTLGATLLAPGRSGFGADSIDPPILRATAPQALTETGIEPPVPHYPGYWRLHAMLDRLMLKEPPPRFPHPPYPGIEEARNLPYGPDLRQRLDVLAPAQQASAERPVLVFVHGGNWTGGDKRFVSDVLYENVAYWAARQGMVAVNINYRLADYGSRINLYPTQEQDVAAALDWVSASIERFGGNPDRIFLWGHSAGGSAIATYVGDAAIHGATAGVKGVYLLSAPLDPAAEEKAGRPIRYFGTTHEQFVLNAPLKRLIASDVPVMIGYSPQEGEMVPEIEQSIKSLCDHGHCPAVAKTHGTHDGEVRSIGSADHSTTDPLLAFMASIH